MSVNYCRKCKTEVPRGETCPYCGGKLAKTSELVSFGFIRVPVREWFAWNDSLRIIIPVLFFSAVAEITAEAVSGGTQAVLRLLEKGMLITYLLIFTVLLAIVWIMLSLQGTERVHCVLDKEGVHLRTYIMENETTSVSLTARFLNRKAIKQAQEEDERPALPGLMLIRHTVIPWGTIRRVKFWEKGGMLLFYRIPVWQAAAVCCPYDIFPEAEAYILKKLKRNKKAKVDSDTEKKG